jgi:hypothetical protein
MSLEAGGYDMVSHQRLLVLALFIFVPDVAVPAEIKREEKILVQIPADEAKRLQGIEGETVRRTEQRSVATRLEWIRVATDNRSFVLDRSGKRFVPWGFNYDHDDTGRLIEDYWVDQWAVIEEDFLEMKRLGANVVRIHLQLGKFMDAADRLNERSLAQLCRIVCLEPAGNGNSRSFGLESAPERGGFHEEVATTFRH